jgi:hypothetical protein
MEYRTRIASASNRRVGWTTEVALTCCMLNHWHLWLFSLLWQTWSLRWPPKHFSTWVSFGWQLKLLLPVADWTIKNLWLFSLVWQSGLAWRWSLRTYHKILGIQLTNLHPVDTQGSFGMKLTIPRLFGVTKHPHMDGDKASARPVVGLADLPNVLLCTHTLSSVQYV